MALLSPAGRRASNNGRAKSWDRAYVRSTVFIEARAMYRADGPIDMRPAGEIEFVQGLEAASASGLYGPMPGGRGDRRPCRPKARRPGRAGAGGAQSGEP
jgi:hypothetical protein